MGNCEVSIMSPLTEEEMKVAHLLNSVSSGLGFDPKYE